MSDDDYKHGYDHGFEDGWNAACKTYNVGKKKLEQKDYKFQEGCPVCGIGKNGEPLGVRCQHPNCPPKIAVNAINDTWEI